MKKGKIASIVWGIGIIITTIMMIIRLSIVADEFSMNQLVWTLDVKTAVQMTGIFYGIVIGIFTIILVLINVLKKP